MLNGKCALITGSTSGIGLAYAKALAAEGCEIMMNGVADADVIMMLRIQRERLQPGMMSTVNEYSRFYGLDLDRLKSAHPDVLVMHPGPINRGVEMTPDVADSEQSVILEQVTNGVAVRMALLYLLLGGEQTGGEEDAS